ncbi:MAG: nucleoside deaminase [Bacteroidales bacterium]|jgi:tRNA(adenine34) deaminase|nr:nucleoside deaminase [Bacteroidales bacterium]
MHFNHDYFMREALREARMAFEKDEVPVGAVVVWKDDSVISRAHNMVEQLNDVTAHAEMLALTAAANAIGGKYLSECTLYVTLEPCVMCAGASFWTQIGCIAYGASDPKRGFSRIDTRDASAVGNGITHPKTIIIGGILANECSELLKQFFEKKRCNNS